MDPPDEENCCSIDESDKTLDFLQLIDSKATSFAARQVCGVSAERQLQQTL